MSPALRVCVAQLSSGFGRIRHSKTHTQVKGRDKNYEVPLPLNRKVSSKMPGDKPKGLLSNSCLDRHSGKYQSTAQDRRPPPSHLVQQTEDESLSGTSVSPFLSALFFQSGQAPKDTHLSVLFSSLKAIRGDSHCPPCCFKDSTQADSSWPRLLPLSLQGLCSSLTRLRSVPPTPRHLHVLLLCLKPSSSSPRHLFFSHQLPLIAKTQRRPFPPPNTEDRG